MDPQNPICRGIRDRVSLNLWRSSTMSSAQKITLLSSNGDTFEMYATVALQSQTLKYMIEDDCADNRIPMPNVTSKILSMVIEYCNMHDETAKSHDRAPIADEALKKWDSEFVNVDQATLFDLILVSCLASLLMIISSLISLFQYSSSVRLIC